MKVQVLVVHSPRLLTLLQYVEFSGFDEEESSIEKIHLSLPDPNAGKVIGREGKSLETLLAIKNKRLQEELTKIRVCLFFFRVLNIMVIEPFA